MKTRIQNGFKVNGKKFVRVALLAYAIAAPDWWQWPYDWHRVGLFALREFHDEGYIATLVARIFVALALFYMLLAEA